MQKDLGEFSNSPVNLNASCLFRKNVSPSKELSRALSQIASLQQQILALVSNPTNTGYSK